VARPRAVEGYGRLPLSFEVNRGQTDAQVRFLARGQGYTLFLTSQQAVLSVQKSEGGSRKREELGNPGSEFAAGRLALFNEHPLPMTDRFKPQGTHRTTNAVLQMQLVGANSNARVSGAEELPGKSNYFIGNDPKKWRTNIPTYAKVQIEDIYPGVDLVYYGNQGQLEYDFVVRPGADPNAIKLALASAPKGKGSPDSRDSVEASSVKIDGNGDLVVQADGGEVRFHKPVVYQPASAESGRPTAEKTLVAGRYTINDQKEVAFAIGEYDKTKPLVIDPVLAYSTYLGGSQQEQGYGVAVDSSGNAYVTGYTISKDFPISNAFQPTNHSAFLFGANAFVTKFNADGSALLYSTYLGGNATDFAFAIAVDGSGNAYVTGQTDSTDFPTVNPLQAAYAGAQDSFLTKLSADGSALLYSTYLGGSGNDEPSAIAVDGSSSAYVTGWTDSTNFPTTPGAFQGSNHAVPPYTANAFVVKFSPNGSALAYSTYLGGSRGDRGAGIAVDRAGNAYVTGGASSTDFPTANAFQSSMHDFGAAFVTELNANASALVYSTYLGGTSHPNQGMLVGGSGASGIAVDSSGNAYVTGSTYCTDFPTTVTAYQGSNHASPSGSPNAFLTKFNSGGSALVYSTYLGGSRGDQANGIAINSSGNAYLTGYTADTDFPTASPIQANNNASNIAGRNAFVTEFTPDGSGLVYSTYLGGSGNDTAYGIAVDGSNNTYVTGAAGSPDFPIFNPFQATKHNQSYSVFVAKIGFSADLTISNGASTVTLSGTALTYTIMVFNHGPDTSDNVVIRDLIPAGATFNSVLISNGSCTAPAPGGTGTVTCTVPILGQNEGDTVIETLVLNVTPASGSVITDTATVSSATFDPNTADNSATATTTVVQVQQSRSRWQKPRHCNEGQGSS